VSLGALLAVRLLIGNPLAADTLHRFDRTGLIVKAIGNAGVIPELELCGIAAKVPSAPKGF